MDQLKQGQTIIGLQSGTNKFASQKGMTMGGVRHVADIRFGVVAFVSDVDVGVVAVFNVVVGILVFIFLLM